MLLYQQEANKTRKKDIKGSRLLLLLLLALLVLSLRQGTGLKTSQPVVSVQSRPSKKSDSLSKTSQLMPWNDSSYFRPFIRLTVINFKMCTRTHNIGNTHLTRGKRSNLYQSMNVYQIWRQKIDTSTSSNP